MSTIGDKLRATTCAYAAAQETVATTTVEDFAREFGCKYFIERALTFCPEIREKLWKIPCDWSRQLKSSAGYFRASHGVTLHPGLKFAAKYHAQEVFLHEVAHAMQWLAHGRVNHGATWHKFMYQLGQNPVRCHNIPECRDKADMLEVDAIAKDFGL